MLICFQIKRSVFLRGFHSARKLLGDDVHVCLLFFFFVCFVLLKHLVVSTCFSQKSGDQVYSWGRAKVRQG